MNNKQKREYIDCLALLDRNCFVNEMQRRNQVLRQSPNSLYKYRAFDKYTFEMISNNYAYLTPVKDLDDPFDCLTNFNFKGIYNPKQDLVTSKFIDYIIKSTNFNLDEDKKIALKESLNNCLQPGGFNIDKTAIELKKFGLGNNDATQMAMFLVNSVNFLNDCNKANAFNDLAEVTYDSSEKIGVCSLSETRDNKVMWSLYGKKYQGYCVEYDIPSTVQARRFLYPVLYSRRISNNFVVKMYDTIIAETNRNVFRNHFDLNPNIDKIGSIYDLFCIKDTDWAYQKEWRVVGGAQDHFTQLRIKAVYLGYNVCKTNETRMIRYAKKYHFDLYKMKPPDGNKKIKYRRTINGTTQKNR